MKLMSLIISLTLSEIAQSQGVKPMPPVPTIDSNYVILDDEILDNFTVNLMSIERRIYFRIFNDKGEEANSEKENNLTYDQNVRNTIQAGNYLISESDSVKLGFKIVTADTLTHQFKISTEFIWNYPYTQIENFDEESTDSKNHQIKCLIIQNETNKKENTFGLTIVNLITKDTMILNYYFLEIRDYFLDIKFQKGIYNISVPESVYSSDKFRFMKISESERIPIISPRQYKKFEMKKNRKSQKTNLFKSY
jgi:hypothetical protein